MTVSHPSPQPALPAGRFFSAFSARKLALALFLVPVLALSALSLSAARAADGFLTNEPDLPLMEGLEEVEGSGFVFDKPEGRLVEAFASGAVDPYELVRFYKSTLPQLGWQPEKSLSQTVLIFTRDGERLEIAWEESGGEVMVRYLLSPR